MPAALVQLSATFALLAQLADHRLAISLRFHSFSYQEVQEGGQAVLVDTRITNMCPLSSNDRAHVHVSKLEDTQPS